MANAMAVGMIGKEAMDDPNQPWDALGEVCNIVAGSFKHYTGAVGQNSVLSVPTVIYGCDYHIRPLAQGTVLECVMQAEAGLLHLRLDYKLT
jgi:CheY-specific phosphatase CheX